MLLRSVTATLLLLLVLPCGLFLCCAAESAESHLQEQESTVDTTTTTTTTSSSSFAVAGYLPDYRIEAVNVSEISRHLTDLILFSVQPHSRGMVGGCCLSPKHYEKARRRQAKQQHNNNNNKTNVWVAVGGAGRGGDVFYQSIAGDKTKRQRFIQSLWRLCEKEDLDGIDLDLDHDAQTPTDLANFALFLQEAAQVWKNPSNNNTKQLKMAVTLHPGRHVPMEAVQVLDVIRIMTYDMVGGGGRASSGHHAQLIPKVQQAVDHLVHTWKYPRHKGMIGIPFYGRHLTQPQNVKTFYELLFEYGAHSTQTS